VTDKRCWVCNAVLPKREGQAGRAATETCSRRVSPGCFSRRQSVRLHGAMPTVEEAARLWRWQRVVLTTEGQAALRRKRNLYQRRQYDKRFAGERTRRPGERLPRHDDEPDDGEPVVSIALLPDAPDGCTCHAHSPTGTAGSEFVVHVCDACGGRVPCPRCHRRDYGRPARAAAHVA